MGKTLACALALVLVLAIPASAEEPPQASPAGPARPGRVLDIRAVERDGGKPIAGVAIVAKSGREDGPAFRGTTDDRGHCDVPVPPDAETSRHFAVHVWKDGFVPVRVLWGSTREFEFEGVPAAYTVILDRGVPIGGIVRDEQGRPVAGARVFPTFAGTRRSEIEYLDLPPDLGFSTDVQGRWHAAILPASRTTGEIGVRVEHPRYLSSGREYDRRLPIKDLRALTAALVMQAGFTLRGTVTDQDGRPIEGATVVWRGTDWPSVPLRVKAGAGGRFAFENRPSGISLIAAEVPGLATGVKQVQLGPRDPNQGPPMMPMRPPFPVDFKPPAKVVPIAPAATGLMPAIVTVDAQGLIKDAPLEPIPPAVLPDYFPSDATQLARDGPCEPPLVFRLGPGRTIRGRVVDTKGRPVAGASITPELLGRWDLLGWRAETGADGRFEWKNAPLEPIVLKVENAAEGQEVRRFGPGPQDGDIVVTMPAPFRLRGKVVDAETGRPIERFRLIEGDVWTHDFNPEEDEGPQDWSLGRARTIVGGHYEVRFPRSGRPGEDRDRRLDEYTLLVIRIEAEGYAPAISRKYRSEEGEQTLDFSLRKQPWINGVVRAPDGSPVAGAEVVVAVKGGPAPGIYNGRLAKGWHGDVVRTGPDGRYAFARPDQGGRVVIVSDRGLAQRTVDELAAGPDVTLEPWGRVRGQLRVGTQPGARRIVGATVWEPDYRGDPIVAITARALTDAEGRFLLDRVAPGHAMLYRPSWSSNAALSRSHRQGVDVASGQTTEVMMGGTGRPVVGRVTRASGLPDFDLSHVKGQLRAVQPEPEFPEGFDEWDAARQRSWWFAFYQTEEGRAYNERANKSVVKVESDGSFRLDDVPEGRYMLELTYATDPSEPFSDQEHTKVKVAVLEQYLEIPAGPDDKPLDLGTLTLTPPELEAVDR